jgi:hypothetical protein
VHPATAGTRALLSDDSSRHRSSAVAQSEKFLAFRRHVWPAIYTVWAVLALLIQELAFRSAEKIRVAKFVPYQLFGPPGEGLLSCTGATGKSSAYEPQYDLFLPQGSVATLPNPRK